MRTWFPRQKGALICVLLVALAGTTPGQILQLASTIDPAQAPPAGGGGGSGAAIMTPDGRYVLFASTANNLSLTTNNTPMKPLFAPPLNVFLRDRTSGTTTLVSADLTGLGGGNDDSIPLDISADGRWALFESSATNLVSYDTNNAMDIFLRDVVNQTTTLISGSTNGRWANGDSRDGTMTPDGRYVAFVSAAYNLVPGDSNRISDVFVRDVLGGVTALASVGAKSTNVNSGSSEAPEITPDGRYVAFFSTATNLVAGVQTTGDIYVRDLVGGTTVWASSGARDLVQSILSASNAVCYNHALSTNGQIVAYEASPATGTPSTGLVLRYDVGTGLTDLVHTNAAVATAAYQDLHDLDLSPDGRFIAFVANTNSIQGATTCVLLWDAQTGGSTLVSGDTNNLLPANILCDWPMLDASGRYVCFWSTATNLTTNTLVGDHHVYVRDTLAGVTTLADADTNGVGSPVAGDSIPSFSQDGRFVVFACADGNLVSSDRNRESDLFVRDLASGGIELISARHPALASASGNSWSTAATPCAPSADGRYFAFGSDADNLTANDTNRCRDVFVHDFATGSNLLVSVNTNGFSGDGLSTDPATSADGRYIGFASYADDLLAGDTNKAQDVFIRDLQTGATTLVSVNSAGTGPGNKDSYSPALSADGQYVLFRSKATNLAAGTFTGTDNLFLRNRGLGVTYALTTAGLFVAAMTPDGRFVAFTDTSGATAGKFYVWDTLGHVRVSTNTTAAPLVNLAISPDGNRVAYWAGSGVAQLSVLDRAAKISSFIVAGPAPTSHPALRFSANGQSMAYNKLTTGTNQVYLYDFHTFANLLVSHVYNSSGGAPLGSDSADISADGRFVAYRSAATNLVAGNNNSVPGVYRYDRQTGGNTLLSVSRFGGSGNNRSLAPVFSADGQTLLFQTWASDLVIQDFNQKGDVLALTPLYVSLLPSAGADQPAWISWPVAPGYGYRVQFKTNIAQKNWQVLGGIATNSGTKGYLADPDPAAAQRFYRVTTY